MGISIDVGRDEAVEGFPVRHERRRIPLKTTVSCAFLAVAGIFGYTATHDPVASENYLGKCFSTDIGAVGKVESAWGGHATLIFKSGNRVGYDMENLRPATCPVTDFSKAGQ